MKKRRDLRAGMAEIYPVDLKWEYAVERHWPHTLRSGRVISRLGTEDVPAQTMSFNLVRADKIHLEPA